MRSSNHASFWAVLLTAALMLGACSSADQVLEGGEDPAAAESPTDSSDPEADSELPAESAETSDADLFPDVLDGSARSDGDRTWTISATLSSPYDSPDRYADGWRVVGPDGTVYGERILTHDHAGEQPFTRSQGGIKIPESVSSVIIEGRDQVSGYGGQTFELTLPAS